VAVEPGTVGFHEIKDTIHVDDSPDVEVFPIPAKPMPSSRSQQETFTQQHLFKDLLPGRKYEVALRAKNQFAYTPWTDSFIFQTSQGRPKSEEFLNY